VLGSVVHNEEAKNAGVDFIDVDGLKAFNKEKSKIRKWAKQYDTLLGSDIIVKQVNKLLGNVLIKMGKFPISMNEGEKVVVKIEELKNTIKFQLKKSICLGSSVGYRVHLIIEHSSSMLRSSVTTSTCRSTTSSRCSRRDGKIYARSTSRPAWASLSASTVDRNI